MSRIDDDTEGEGHRPGPPAADEAVAPTGEMAESPADGAAADGHDRPGAAIAGRDDDATLALVTVPPEPPAPVADPDLEPTVAMDVGLLLGGAVTDETEVPAPPGDADGPADPDATVAHDALAVPPDEALRPLPPRDPDADATAVLDVAALAEADPFDDDAGSAPLDTGTGTSTGTDQPAVTDPPPPPDGRTALPPPAGDIAEAGAPGGAGGDQAVSLDPPPAGTPDPEPPAIGPTAAPPPVSIDPPPAGTPEAEPPATGPTAGPPPVSLDPPPVGTLESGPPTGPTAGPRSVSIDPPSVTTLASEPPGGPGSGAASASGAGLAKSSGVVAVGTVLSRITGLLRTILTGAVLGVVGLGAAYNLANNTPNMIYDLLLGGVLSATLVPVLVGNRERDDHEGTAAVLSVATAALAAITVLAIVFAPVIIGLYARLAALGLNEPTADERELAVALLRLFAPQVLFYGLTTLGSSYLNAHGRFAAAAVAPVVNNIWMLLILASAWVALGERSIGQVRADPLLVWLLGAGTTVGILAMALVLLPAIARAGLPMRWNFDLSNPAVRQVAKLSGWTVGYVVANQVCLFVLMGLAGRLVSTWAYAYQFFQLPYGVFTVSIMTAFTPELSRLGAQGRMREFRERFLQGFRFVLLALLPATVLIALLARPLIWAVFAQWGRRFTADDVGPTAATLMALSWGMVGFSVYLYALRGFYVLKNTKTPFLINLFENALTLVLAVVLDVGLGWGVEGLAWAWSGAYFVSGAVALARLRAYTGPFGFETAVATTAMAIRLLMATGVMLAVLAAIRFAIPDTEGIAAWANLVVGTVVGLAAYVISLMALGVREVRELPRTLLRRA
jgi:putative peptidoglycan lipid II flippase